jgi:hypothetical protein
MDPHGNRRIITVRIEGGVVQDVKCPPDIQVLIKDYDTEGIDEADLAEDKNGRHYLEMSWG